MDLHKLSLLSQADGGPMTTINAISWGLQHPSTGPHLPSPPHHTGQRSSSTEIAAQRQPEHGHFVETDRWVVSL